MAENNNEKRIELEEGEIMRMSIRIDNSETGEYHVCFASNGDGGVIVQGIQNVLEKEFGLTCVPKDARLGIAICIPRYDEEDEEGEEAEEDENAQRESEE